MRFASGTSISRERGAGSPTLSQILQKGMTVISAPTSENIMIIAKMPNPNIPGNSIISSFLRAELYTDTPIIFSKSS